MQEYTFKSAAFRKPQSWTIREGHLLKRGAEAALKLSEVSRATWGDMTHRGTRNAWLHLTGPDGVVKIECSDAGGSKSRETFLKLCHKVCETLAREHPDLPIRQGGGDALRWSLFLIGLGAALVGLFFVWAGITGNVKRGEVMAIMLGAGFAGVFGLMVWSFAPWRDVQTLSPKEMTLLLGGMTAPMDGPDDDA